MASESLVTNQSTPESNAALIGQQFLRLYLVPDTKVLLPIDELVEVLTIPIGQIVPIPHVPPWVMGVYNWRGEILWMIDLGQLVGLTPWHQQNVNSSSYMSVVLNGDLKDEEAEQSSTQVGLVVTKVEDLEWCDPELIQDLPSSMMAKELASFLQGYWLKPNGEMLVVLDCEAITAAMPKP